MSRLKKAYELGDESAAAELSDRLEGDLVFGTAGLRAPMGPGFSRMNEITGLADYLKETGGRKVIVGHDHRHNSLKFAKCTIATLKHAGLNVLSFPQIVPTPFVPFAVQAEGADCGIMITASHNPAGDNGYKVQILGHIRAQNYTLWSISSGANDEYGDIFDRTNKAYFASIIDLLEKFKRTLNLAGAPSVVYTPVHGVGMEFAERAVEFLGLPPLLPVPSQKDPNPDFPTVKFPNPEEGSTVLQAAFEHAKITKSNLIFANDPDADRFNCGELTENGWKVFNGNEIAVLFADFLWRNRSAIYPGVKEFVMLESIVSSHMIRSIGLKEGFATKETPTGFKHLANTAQKLERENPDLKVLLAFEEAIGFMINTAVWDKDGISALALMYLMVVELYSRGETLSSALEAIYTKYGYFAQYNSYYFCDPHKIPSIFTTLRTKLHERIPGSSCADLTGPCQISLNTECAVMSIKDYPDSQMITLNLDPEGASWVTLRASGTEPKLKFYSEFRSKYAERMEAGEKLKAIVKDVCGWLLEPEANGLKFRGE